MGVDRLTDTIAAAITPPGRGAVAIIRVTGPRAFDVAHSVFNGLPESPAMRHAYYGSFVHGDDGLCLLFAEDASFTGEPVAEFNIHGSTESVRALLEACFAHGVRMAEPGEFSLRAFMNGQIDLAQAEGIRATVDAVTDRQLSMANSMREGRVATEIESISNAIRKTLTTIEALTDFSEELGDIPLRDIVGPLMLAQPNIAAFINLRPIARRVREGALVVIAGQPNAGKSSLLNALLKSDRAIVTEIPGTTRDSIEEQISLDGIPVRLVDTAGLRESNDEVEILGVSRSRQLMVSADVILYVYDSAKGWQPSDEAEVQPYKDKSIIVANKSDLARAASGEPISTVTGEGLAELTAFLLRRLINPDVPEPTTLADRHYEVMIEVGELVQESIDALLEPNLPDDLAAVTLRAALRKMGELTGESAPADVLEQIFSQFCIGK